MTGHIPLYPPTNYQQNYQQVAHTDVEMGVGAYAGARDLADGMSL